MLFWYGFRKNNVGDFIFNYGGYKAILTRLDKTSFIFNDNGVKTIISENKLLQKLSSISTILSAREILGKYSFFIKHNKPYDILIKLGFSGSLFMSNEGYIDYKTIRGWTYTKGNYMITLFSNSTASIVFPNKKRIFRCSWKALKEYILRDLLEIISIKT